MVACWWCGVGGGVVACWRCGAGGGVVACWLSVCNTLHSISSNSKKAKCELSYTNIKNV